MSIKDDMEDVQEAVINELISDNGLNPLTVGDLQITTAKIADDAVTLAKLGSDIDLGQVNDDAVTLAKLGSDVDLGQVNDDAVTLAKLGSDVDLGQVNDGAVTPAKLSQAYLPLTGGSVTGNVLVGTADANLYNTSTETGIALRDNEKSAFSRSGGVPLYINRLSSDGGLLHLAKDGTTVGSIGTVGGDMVVGTGDVGFRFDNGSDVVTPWNTSTNSARDNAVDIGHTSARFDDIYATNGAIQTSDRNEKQDIEELSEAEQRVAVACKGLLRKFRWKSSVEENGEEARIHFGIIAQDLQAAFEAEGLDAGRYAMFISSTWTDEETEEEKTRLGVRYSELLAFIISAI
jgi:hypothetical protein